MANLRLLPDPGTRQNLANWERQNKGRACATQSSIIPVEASALASHAVVHFHFAKL